MTCSRWAALLLPGLLGSLEAAAYPVYGSEDRGIRRLEGARLAHEEGMFVGGSCGMAMAGAVQWLEANRDALRALSADVGGWISGARGGVRRHDCRRDASRARSRWWCR